MGTTKQGVIAGARKRSRYLCDSGKCRNTCGYTLKCVDAYNVIMCRILRLLGAVCC